MPLAVIFGAGKVGRGFLAQLLHDAGWEIHFVDRDAGLSRALDGATYKLCNLATGEVSEIGPVRGTPDVMRGEVAALVSVADLLLTSIGGDNLAEWAEWMKESIECRVMFGPIEIGRAHV